MPKASALPPDPPFAYFDPNSGITFYVESDGRHLAAIDKNGKVLWVRNPFVDNNLCSYRLPNTRAAQRRIVTTYFDSTPLGSRPGYGKVIGLGDGLRAWYGINFAKANHLLFSRKLSAAEAHQRARIYKDALILTVTALTAPFVAACVTQSHVTHLTQAVIHKAPITRITTGTSLPDTHLKVPLKCPLYDKTGIASWYGRHFSGRLTASAEIFHSNALTAAHRTLPFGSCVLVTIEQCVSE